MPWDMLRSRCCRAARARAVGDDRRRRLRAGSPTALGLRATDPFAFLYAVSAITRDLTYIGKLNSYLHLAQPFCAFDAESRGLQQLLNQRRAILRLHEPDMDSGTPAAVYAGIGQNARRSWRPYPSQEKLYLLGIQSSNQALKVQVTDLCSWWLCEANEAVLERQCEEQSLASSAEEMRDMIIRCFEEKDGLSDEHYTFTVCPAKDGYLSLTWSAGAIHMKFECMPVDDSAIRIRNEMLLPLLRTAEQLLRLLPPQAAWHPPPESLPLPSFNHEVYATIWSHAASDAANNSHEERQLQSVNSRLSEFQPATLQPAVEQDRTLAQQPDDAGKQLQQDGELRRRMEKRARAVKKAKHQD
eukprot:6189453-Pleurochrysis_carterae.AAC.4